MYMWWEAGWHCVLPYLPSLVMCGGRPVMGWWKHKEIGYGNKPSTYINTLCPPPDHNYDQCCYPSVCFCWLWRPSQLVLSKITQIQPWAYAAVPSTGIFPSRSASWDVMFHVFFSFPVHCMMAPVVSLSVIACCQEVVYCIMKAWCVLVSVNLQVQTVQTVS